MKVRQLVAGATLVFVALLSGCVTPALNRGAFVQNGRAAVDSAVSVVGAASLAVEARLAGDATRAYADVVVTESEAAIAPIEASYGGVDPPDRADDQMRDKVVEALGSAGDALAQSRIAVRRDDDEAMRAAALQLRQVRTALSALRVSLGESVGGSG
jgi:hypothetical protein